MSYSEQRKGFSPASIGTVVAVHVAIGYAFISGLAYQVIHTGPLVTTAILLPDPKAPPPNMPPPPEARRTAVPQPVAEERIVDMPLTLSQPALDQFPVSRPVFDLPVETIAQPQAKAAPVLTRGAVPMGARAEWVTADDYPPAAVREGVEGSVGIDVAIDAKGRVTGCSVTATSGSDLLDQATCRLYSRRARFTPALDEAGQPVATRRADRVRWQIPQ